MVYETCSGALHIDDALTGDNDVSLNVQGGDAAWSPNGKWIAYYSLSGGLYVISPNGGTPVLEDPNGIGGPSWFPDSTAIADTTQTLSADPPFIDAGVVTLTSADDPDPVGNVKLLNVSYDHDLGAAPGGGEEYDVFEIKNVAVSADGTQLVVVGNEANCTSPTYLYANGTGPIEPASCDDGFDTPLNGFDSANTSAWYQQMIGVVPASGGEFSPANALDKLAWGLQRRITGRVVSIDWGPWAGTGMVSPDLEREYAKRQIRLIDPDRGVEALMTELGAARGEAQVIWTASDPRALSRRPTN